MDRFIAKIMINMPKHEVIHFTTHFERMTGQPAYFAEYVSVDPFLPNEYAFMYSANSLEEAQLIAEALYKDLVRAGVQAGEPICKKKES